MQSNSFFAARTIVITNIVCLFSLTIAAQSVRQVKLSRFTLQSSAVVKDEGAVISSASYQAPDYWYPVTVPSTVLTGLVANKVYPDPYTGMNNMLIPDASDSFNHQYHLAQYSHLPGEPNPWKKPYWYRTTFFVPAADKGRHFQLIFKGINYRADVWLNGRRIADSSRMVGMFEEFYLDADPAIKAGETNALAVKIYPLDEPGLPAEPQLEAMDDFYENGGPTGDIGKNVTMLSSVGWDWIPEVRDRNMGIWQPVYLRTTGQVIITHPQIITDLPDTNTAKLSLNINLSNTGSQPLKGKLTVTIIPENFSGGQPITFTKDLTAEANATGNIHLTPGNTPSLTIRNPRLWWPNGYGNPNLYRIRLRFADQNGISEDTSFLFGIRTVGSTATDVHGYIRRDFYVNGRRVHLVGGAWVPDMMLNRDYQRYDYELKLCRNANVNLVRIWGGGLGETDDFYELADRYGLLVWQDFWITGDTNGGFKGSADWPLQTSVFVNNVISTILRIRNHPSLLVWTGGNEGHARKELYDAMRDNVANLDGTRPFIPCSSGFSKAPEDWKGSWPDNKLSGVYSGGPYSWQDDAQYYRLVNEGKGWVFKDETGIPSQPPYNTLAKIIPNLAPDPRLPYPLNNTWGYHDACTGNGRYDTYYKAMVARYGAPNSLRDFSEKMQLLNANGYRSIFEATGHKLRETGGVMLWKLNAAFPSVVWQVYDWFLEPNAGYYFMQRACEPLHIQLNLDDSSVALVNRTYQSRKGLSYNATIIDLNGKTLFKQEGRASIDTTDARSVLSLAEPLRKIKGISFVQLTLQDAAGKTISRNTYWMSPEHDFTTLRQMPAARVQVQVTPHPGNKTYRTWTVQCKNTSDKLAFFLNPQVTADGEEVLPSYWSDNYFSVPPGGTITATVSCPTAMLKGAPPELRLEGWNIPQEHIPLPR
ncbi:glycoside hydrolase family 2 TIM barrel-domain containing protein [Flavitalea sp. BT771]|uniref:glycoside hydrolase family 2 protein n=1 Tax=Flavitalea sp. BT771 TaxID=3063329 RepID=UPI0026E28C37|nr:glycoside hydrolase family 2 TIM barrel-domain containing protein [Flavitalea sp. BT771]MDO6433451.1 glycoside hydrolase family 2 TIM barrel-domain containing protein [Flavitalea sp. BT771]MDV6222644.1 glycoside hydrolase family 2 TIM barrel-domain containing protein [Flavitalea sp. BT771]